MMLNLPNLESAFNGKTQEQILDALHKYRKELNFLLMNLDESNMPGIAGRLDGLDGSFSLIDQQLDSITLAVGNAQGDISALSVRADGIDLAVSNLDGDLSALQITVSGISTTVSNHTGQISTINQTVSGIQTTVSSHTTTIGTHTSQISQLSGEISSIVSFTDVDGNDIASKINQTATTIKLQASKIDLTGITRIYDPNYPTRYAQFVGNQLTLVGAASDRAIIFSDSASITNRYSTEALEISAYGYIDLVATSLNLIGIGQINWGGHVAPAAYA